MHDFNSLSFDVYLCNYSHNSADFAHWILFQVAEFDYINTGLDLNLTQLLCSLDVFVVEEFTAVQLLVKHRDQVRVSVHGNSGH